MNKSISIIEKLGKPVRHIHLHDNLGGQSQIDDLHLPIGDGTVDLKGILTSLMIADYDGTMTLEVKPEFQEDDFFYDLGNDDILAIIEARKHLHLPPLE